MHRLLLLTIVLTCSCDPAPPATPADVGEPPQWVVEANERSKRQTAEPEPAPTPKIEQLIEHPYLWKVTGKTAPSYLLGSHESTRLEFQAMDRLPQSVQDAFDQCSTVVDEADPSVGLDPDSLDASGGDNGLKARLSETQWQSLRTTFDAPPGFLQTLAPWSIALVLLSKWTPDGGSGGMAHRFRILARAHGKELEFLETLEEVAKARNASIDTDVVAHMIQHEKDVRESMERAFVVFRAGTAKDWRELEPLLPAEKAGTLLYDRNDKWVQKLTPRFVDEGGLFVIVPASHLLGEHSVPDLLAKNDALKVERIDAAPQAP